MTENKTPEQKIEVSQEQFDTTRRARQALLDQVRDILNRSDSGNKINDKDIKQALSALKQYATLSEDLVTMLLSDLYTVVKAVANSELNTFALRTNVKTIVRALEKLGIINEDMMRTIHDTEILPEELRRLGGNESTEQILRVQDITENK